MLVSDFLLYGWLSSVSSAGGCCARDVTPSPYLPIPGTSEPPFPSTPSASARERITSRERSKGVAQSNSSDDISSRFQQSRAAATVGAATYLLL